MTDEKNREASTEQNPENNNEKALHVKNPFDKNDKKEITQEDIDNEQMFKEAQTERD